MSNLPNPQIEMVPWASLRANPKTVKRHSDRKIALVASSIAEYGWTSAVVIDDDNVIQAGHARFFAAKKLGHRLVPCIRVANLTQAAREKYLLLDNRLADIADYDQVGISDLLKSLVEIGEDIEITGYTLEDIDFSVEVLPSKESDDAFLLPPVDVQPVTRVGDIWQVGDQKLMCGDARVRANWEELLCGAVAVLVFTDLPYNVRIDGHVSGNGKNKHREFVMGAGEMSPSEFIAFMRDIFRNMVRFSIDGSIHYHCMDWRHMREILEATDGLYAEFKQLIVWAKTNAGQGTFYRSNHELVFVFKNGRAKHINNFKLGETGRYRTNVVEYAGANTFRKGRDEDLAAHSTVKPTAMVMDFILDCSHQGDLVLDPTVGSGTTLIAAHRTKRRGAGMELDPLYCDVAIRRLSKAVGQPAILAGDGRTFEAIKAERLGQEADQ